MFLHPRSASRQFHHGMVYLGAQVLLLALVPNEAHGGGIALQGIVGVAQPVAVVGIEDVVRTLDERALVEGLRAGDGGVGLLPRRFLPLIFNLLFKKNMVRFIKIAKDP